MENRTKYQKYVQDRTRFKYYRGLLSRWLSNIGYSYARFVARRNGAHIGEGVIMPLSLAKILNSNCTIGNHVSIQTDKIDVRTSLIIGNNVIIGKGTEIIMGSHNIDSPDWEYKQYGLEIEDYVWLPTNVLVLPSCRKIGYGAVVGSGSVVVRNIEPMSVVSGNPAKEFKKRKCVHTNLVVESLLHGDYKIFRETYENKDKHNNC